jgi:hypothetical protein
MVFTFLEVLADEDWERCPLDQAQARPDFAREDG